MIPPPKFRKKLGAWEIFAVGNLCCFGSLNWGEEPNRKLQCLLYCELALSEIMELPKVLFIWDQLVFMAEQTILSAFAFAFCSMHDLCFKHICIFRYPRKFVSIEVLPHPTAGCGGGPAWLYGRGNRATSHCHSQQTVQDTHNVESF